MGEVPRPKFLKCHLSVVSEAMVLHHHVHDLLHPAPGSPLALTLHHPVPAPSHPLSPRSYSTPPRPRPAPSSPLSSHSGCPPVALPGCSPAALPDGSPCITAA
eukprot:734370-Rhodomonas_salina.2